MLRNLKPSPRKIANFFIGSLLFGLANISMAAKLQSCNEFVENWLKGYDYASRYYAYECSPTNQGDAVFVIHGRPGTQSHDYWYYIPTQNAVVRIDINGKQKKLNVGTYDEYTDGGQALTDDPVRLGKFSAQLKNYGQQINAAKSRMNFKETCSVGNKTIAYINANRDLMSRADGDSIINTLESSIHDSCVLADSRTTDIVLPEMKRQCVAYSRAKQACANAANIEKCIQIKAPGIDPAIGDSASCAFIK
jgi:hypothetical protein